MTDTVRLIYTDVTANHNKAWHAERTGCSVTYTWGRVGEGMQSTVKTFPDEERAQHDLEKMRAQKLKKGYTEQRTVGAATAQVTNLGHVARSQIAHDGDSETAKLIDFLVTRNIHAIEGATSLRFENGQFTTPLGPVTAEGIAEAEALLEKITVSIETQRTGHYFVGLVNGYLRIIPQHVKRRRMEASDVFPDLAAVKAQRTLLDALRSVLKNAQAASGDAPQVFRTKLSALPATDPEFERIRKLFDRGRNRNHTSAGMKLRRVWRVEIAGAEEAFEAKLGNVKTLWHGTKDANLLSILKGGYVVPRHGGSVAITGRAFGDGIYFSDQSTKSLNYSTGYWGGGRSTRAFMFLNDVAMGREYSPPRTFSGRPPAGYDSTFARAGGVFLNNEQVVYRTSQIRPRFLCEFA